MGETLRLYVPGWRIFFWEPVVSPHKLALFRALAEDPRVASCTYIAEKQLTVDRRAQGWAVGELGDIDLLVAPDDPSIDAIVAGAADPHTIHLFSGVHGPRVISSGISAALRHHARFGIMSEPRASEGMLGLMRLGHSWATERQLRTRASLMLAIGRNGPPWFRRTGYPPAHIYPFAYFLAAPPTIPVLPRFSNAPLVLAYLGRLTAKKGIRVLLDALPLLPPTLRIKVAGIGPEAARVEAAGSASGGRLDYVGALPMSAVPGFLADVDILVQPSLTTDDGWAAVVSEALLAGAAVVATAKVGASILLDDRSRGRVIARPEPRLLAAVVDTLLADGTLDLNQRTARQQWAHTHLTGEAGADYLLRILAHRFHGTVVPKPFYAASGDEQG